jgi:hypothetical protein
MPWQLASRAKKQAPAFSIDLGRGEAGDLRHIICGGVARRSGFGRAVDETEHVERALAAFNLRHDRCHRSH